MAAQSSKDVPIKLRNKLYAALNRFVQRPCNVDSKIAKQWAETEVKGSNSKFDFLKDWAKDTRGGELTLKDEHFKHVKDKNDELYTWYTRYELYFHYNAYKFPEMKSYADKLMLAAKTKPNTDPKFRKDTEMIMFKILTRHTEGHMESNGRLSSMQLAAGVDGEAMGDVYDNFAAPKRHADDKDSPDEKATKVPKIGGQDARVKLVQAHLSEAAKVMQEIDGHSSPYVLPMKESISSRSKTLRAASRTMFESHLDDDTQKVDSTWKEIVQACFVIRQDVHSAQSLMTPKANKPFTTQWDSLLKA